MRKTILTMLIVVATVLASAGNPFEGFKYGMSKDETMTLIKQKAEEGVFDKELGSKRFLMMPQHKYKSDKLKKTVILQARFRFVKKKLADIEITPYTGGSIVSGGFSKGKARALQSELEDKFNDLGVGAEWDLVIVSSYMYRLYSPIATLDL